MKASEVSLNNFLSQTKTQFIIPVYQRNYEWGEPQITQLIQDIVDYILKSKDTAKPKYYIGSLIAYERKLDGSVIYETIDGQQRLTTINITYVALYRFAKDNGKVQDAERLYNMYLTNQYVKNESSKLKLKQTDTNSLAFKAIMLGTDNESSTFSNVIENYNYFRSAITEDTFELISNGLKLNL